MIEPRTIALTYNDDYYLHRFKGGLLRALSEAGHKVYAIAPAGDSVEAIESEGAKFIDWQLSRRGVSPPGELRSLTALHAIYRRTKPDLVHHFTAKPRVYGAIAARFAGVPVVVASVNGLGYVYTEQNLKSAIARPVVSVFNRLAFGLSGAVLFQNHDDANFFNETGVLSKKKVRHIPGGSGVDTGFFSPDSVDVTEKNRLRSILNIPVDMGVVVMISRMLTHKGVHEYVACARAVAENRDVCFLLVGSVDTGNPASIPQETLVEWGQMGWVRYLGERSDIRELMAVADIVALPSYREGFPRVLLEAAAMGRPIVTTDTPGCRDVVDDGENGFLVPVRDAGALAYAVEKLLGSPDLRAQMGEMARLKALDEFDERRVNQGIIDVYDELLSRTPIE